MKLSNKKIVENFFKLVISGNIDEAYSKYIDAKFIHHNMWNKDGRQSLMDAMKQNEKVAPNKVFTIKKIISEGDTVVTHAYLKMTTSDKQIEMTVVHILKIKNGKIVELWDVGQEIPKNSPNKKGAF